MTPGLSLGGDFGPDDQLGRLNPITDAKRLQGMAEVKTGKAFCLSLPLDNPAAAASTPTTTRPCCAPPCAPAASCNDLFRHCVQLPLHEHCLFKLGVHLGELAAWLHAHGPHRFLLTAPPLRLPGAVGSPLTPVATV